MHVLLRRIFLCRRYLTSNAPVFMLSLRAACHRYVIHAVVVQVRDHLGSRSWTRLIELLRVREQYIELYKAKLKSKGSNKNTAVDRALSQLDSTLPLAQAKFVLHHTHTLTHTIPVSGAFLLLEVSTTTIVPMNAPPNNAYRAVAAAILARWLVGCLWP